MTFARFVSVRSARPGLRASVFATILLLAPHAVLAADPPADPVVARIDGVELHKSDMLAAQHGLPPQVQQLPLDAIYPQLLDQMVDSQLVVKAGRDAKLAADPEVKQRVSKIEDRVIQQVYLDRFIEKSVTDDKLKAKYDAVYKGKTGKPEVHARHILLPTEAEAKAVIAELDKGGDFAKLATEKSKDPGASNGGDLGWFGKEDMVPEFADAAFKMKPGDYTKTPIKTQFGWHVIKVEETRTAPPPSFDQAKEELRSQVARDMVQARVTELRGKAKVELFQIDGTPAPALTLAPTAATPAPAAPKP
ncbi:MAG TPA: peptidylprolyl isomerase [Stellaceae bacterium]|nr:peptidylprolyl isomerase [Stellaceae bacterium]